MNKGVEFDADRDVFWLVGIYNGTVAIVPLPDLPFDVCGLRGSVLRLILRD